MATLYQIDNDGSRTERWEIDDEPVIVGRSAQAKVSIEDEGLSRRHFLILRDGDGYLIKDLSSRNGTWVDGRRVFAEKLRHNDCILAGNTLFLFADPPAPAPTPCWPRTGPHGTVIMSAVSQPDRCFAGPSLWQRASTGCGRAAFDPAEGND
jgi:pSer/pThr/pTyr-binding forkhead associated (FHA) protein